MKARTKSHVLALVVLSPAVARAQPTAEVPHAQAAADVAQADALFNAGRQLRDEGRYADACAKFADSKRLASGVGVTLYLADCYERVGRTASAWGEFRDAEKLARERSDQRADVARARAKALEASLNGITIAVAPAAAHERPEVLLDGAPVRRESWNVNQPIDPGDHVVTVTLPGQAPRTIPAHVDAANPAATVRIDDVAPRGASPVAATPAEPEKHTAQSGVTGARLGVGLGLVGLGLTGIGVGTGFLVAANQSIASGGPPDDTSALVSEVAFAVAGVALASAIVVFVTAPHEKSPAVVVAPAPLRGGGGAFLRATF